MDDTYKTIETPVEGLFKDKGSRFMAFAWPVESREQVSGILEDYRRKYHDAHHQCYAWRIGTDAEPQSRLNDDGEPSGTAGNHIFGQILSRELTNILIVVIRYFGGTKLGIPGLINAYREAASDALKNSEMVVKTVKARISVIFPYIEMNNIMKLVKESGAEIKEQDFDNFCQLTVEIRRRDEERFLSRAEKIPNVEVRRLEYK